MFANNTHEKAHEALKSGDIKKAIELYTEALKEHPDHRDIISDRAVAYLHNMDKGNCFKDFDRAIELQPDYGYRYAARAFAKNNFGDLDGAIEDYKKAVELDPNDSVAHNNLGLLLEQKGYKKDAEERFERADKLSKMENKLYDMMDELESEPATSNSETVVEDATVIEDEVKKTSEANDASEASTKITSSKEFKKLFTSRKQFKEFINFIKNGFKIK